MSGYTVRGRADPGTELEIDGPGGSKISVTANEDGDWSANLEIFKVGGGKSTAEEMGVPFLGSLPFDPGVVRGGDDGVHRIVADPEGESAKAFAAVVEQINSNIASAGQSSGLEII